MQLMSPPWIFAFGNTSAVIGAQLTYGNCVDVPEIPVALLYKHMISQHGPSLLFEINSDTKEDPLLQGRSWHIQGSIKGLLVWFTLFA